MSRTLSTRRLSWRSSVSILANCSRSLRCSRVRLVGVITETETNKSPLPRPPSTGIPWPRTRKTVPVCVPAGTQTGTVFRVRGQGMPVLGGRGKGDLFVSVSVITPTSLTREQRKLLEQLAKIETEDLQDKKLVDKVRDIFG